MPRCNDKPRTPLCRWPHTSGYNLWPRLYRVRLMQAAGANFGAKLANLTW